MITGRYPELFAAAQQWVAHWGVTDHDRALVVADTGTCAPLLHACYTAISATGADVVLVCFNARPQPFMNVPDLVERVMVEADFYLTLMSESWSYSLSMDRVLRHCRHRTIRWANFGGREEDVAHFVELVPDPAVHERTRRARVLVDGAKAFHLTSPLGTNLRLGRGDPAERVAYAPDGQVAFAMPSETVVGQLALVGAVRSRCPGPVGVRRMVEDPIYLRVDAGLITQIEEDHGNARWLAHWFRQWNDPEVYRVAHVNLGLDHRVKLHYLDNLAVHFNYGGILLGVGTQHSALFGHAGVCQAPAHIELHHTGLTLEIDGRRILENGEFTLASGLGR
jgi:leucyl aminopeptidase (aminopeptidase T)